MFHTILFDVDGVILSEERYFDASALTVWELLSSPQYLGVDSGMPFTAQPEEELIRLVRQKVFANDEVLYFIKDRGINANWDMVYLTFAYHLIRYLEASLPGREEEIRSWLHRPWDEEAIREFASWNTPYAPRWDDFVLDFGKGKAQKQELLLDLNRIAEERLKMPSRQFGRNSALWDLCQQVFQEWYLGEEKSPLSTGLAPRQKGKRGFLRDEIPLVPPGELASLLQSLKEAGIRLGVGTGRPHIETVEPLESIGVLPFFEEERIVTASDVLEAERRHPECAPLAKPQPYTYLKGLYGKQTPDEEIFGLSLPLPPEEASGVLVVGDSVADLMAARSMGCTFCAPLTGLSGQEARGTFEELGADYIVDNVLELKSILFSNR